MPLTIFINFKPKNFLIVVICLIGMCFFSCQKPAAPAKVLAIYEVDTLAFQQLKEELQTLVKQEESTIGISVFYNASNLGFSINGEVSFPLASVYKLPIAATLMQHVGKRDIELNRIVRLELKDKRHSGCFMDDDSTGSTYFDISLQELAQRMMWYSDNCATDAILRILGGPQNVQKQLNTWGYGDDIKVSRYLIEIFIHLAGKKLPKNQMQWSFDRATKILAKAKWAERKKARRQFLLDPRDQGSPNAFVDLLQRLQAGKLLPQKESKWLATTMAGCATGNYFLPEDLPSSYIISHKTGSLPSIYNDAGWLDKGTHERPMTYAVFMKGAWGEPSKERAKIAKIMAKLIYFKPLKRLQ